MARIKSRVVIRKTKPRSAPQNENAFLQHLRTSLIALGFLTGAALLLLCVFLWRSGWFAQKADMAAASLLDLTRRAGFAVNDILVEGRSQTDRDEILNILAIQKGAPILGFDPHKALENLSAITWVKSGVVERRLPGTIFVRLNERAPIAIWQMDKKLKLIDAEGHVLRGVDADEKIALPLVVGDGANKNAAALLEALAPYPALAIKAATRVSNRRWNLLLDNNITIKLPENDMESALARLDKTVHEQDLLKRDIIGLDLRQEDRMIVETSKEIDPPTKVPKIAPPTM